MRLPLSRPGHFGIWMVCLYPIYYIGLFVSRQIDDGVICQKKYGDLWDEYTSKVKYRVVPGLSRLRRAAQHQQQPRHGRHRGASC